VEWQQGRSDIVSCNPKAIRLRRADHLLCCTLISATTISKDTSLTISYRADANIAGSATGAMSYAFIAALKKNPQQSYVQLLNSIRDELEGKYDQKPQLSCSHPLDTDILYVSC